ncbi:MAG: YihY/virulence factor BrkB family protein, partial [Candidatus Omnitrophica bacterium]|nr:YihY/virulence factor BrkB family protein [Candidatus Omnitrophota bacterium]
GIPIRLVRDIMYELVQTGIVAPVQDETNRTPAYQPAIDINALSVKYVIDKLDSRGTDTIPVIDSKELKRIRESLQEFGKVVEKSQSNLLLKDI